MDTQRQALQGLRVLDFAGPSGAYAGKLLAELGADVLKVESPDGDPGRRVGPFAGEPSPDRSIHWWYHNSSKRSIVVEPGSDSGRSRLFELALGADVILDTAADTLEQYGLSSEQLRSANERLIHASLTPFGLNGPRADWKATDIVASALGGLLYLGGMPEHPPSWPGGEQSYMIGSAAAAVAISAALLARDRTGRGQRVDVSLQEATAVATENAIGFWTFRGIIRKRLGNKSFNGAPMVFHATDGWVIGHVGGRWAETLDWIQLHGHDVTKFRAEDWFDAEYRAEHMDEFEPTLTAFLGGLPKEQIYAEGQLRRIVLGPVRNAKEVINDIQLGSRDFWVNMPTGHEGESFTSAGAPYKLSRTPWQQSKSAPRLGENAPGWSGEVAAAAKRDDSADEFGRLPLRGIRVVDFGTNVIVPFTCRTLAAFGAEVIKIESHTRPEGQRNTLVPKPIGKESINTNWLFMQVNPDKHSLAVNLNVPEARELVRTIISQADVVIDNFGVDPMPKWNMTAEELFAKRPDLIIVRCSVNGRSGPLKNYVGLGNTIMSTAGINAITGFEGDPPVSTCTAHPDYSSNAHHTLFAIMSALYHRERTGEGQVIDLSQTESTVCFVGPTLLDYTANGNIQGQPNNRHTQMAPHGVFPCLGDDRWLAIACPDDDAWQALAPIIGADAADPRFATFEARKANEDALDAVVSAWTSQQEEFDAMKTLQAANVPAGVVQTAQDMLEKDEHLADRKFFQMMEHPEAGEVIVMQPHFKLEETPGRVGKPAPLLGADNEWVMNDFLGLDDEEVANLYVTGAVE